jgi:hypothetical protein
MAETEALDLEGVLEGPFPPRVKAILDLAKTEGWELNSPGVTLVVRLTRSDGIPFYARWDVTQGPKGPSYRFQGARAANGQPLAAGDIPVYLKDPSVILPKPPADEELAEEHECKFTGEHKGDLEFYKPGMWLCERHAKMSTPPGMTLEPIPATVAVSATAVPAMSWEDEMAAAYAAWEGGM